ncbi:MAG: ArsR family transcriptional regulator [Nakamurella sp.]
MLHHVRTLVATGFLAPLPAVQGPRGAWTVPYRATRKSWSTEGHGAVRPMIDAFLQSVAALDDLDLNLSRLGLRLDDAGHAELVGRLDEVLQEFAAREPQPGGRPWSVFLAVHPDPDRD